MAGCLGLVGYEGSERARGERYEVGLESLARSMIKGLGGAMDLGGVRRGEPVKVVAQV
jgi:hypothetical protein